MRCRMAAGTDAKTGKVTEAVAVFHDVSSLDAAVEDLRQAGFKRGDISLLASEDAVEKKLGHRYERIQELEDAPDAPRVTYRTRASLGDTEDVIIGSLTYLPAVLAAGTLVASAGIVAPGDPEAPSGRRPLSPPPAGRPGWGGGRKKKNRRSRERRFLTTWMELA